MPQDTEHLTIGNYTFKDLQLIVVSVAEGLAMADGVIGYSIMLHLFPLGCIIHVFPQY